MTIYHRLRCSFIKILSDSHCFFWIVTRFLQGLYLSEVVTVFEHFRSNIPIMLKIPFLRIVSNFFVLFVPFVDTKVGQSIYYFFNNVQNISQ